MSDHGAMTPSELIEQERNGEDGYDAVQEAAERVIEKLTRERDALKDRVKVYDDVCVVIDQFPECVQLRAEVERLTRERDALRTTPIAQQVDELRAEVGRLRALLRRVQSILDTMVKCTTNECENCAENAKEWRGKIRAALGEEER